MCSDKGKPKIVGPAEDKERDGEPVVVPSEATREEELPPILSKSID